MATLTSYISEVRRLLHDANGVFWDDAELTDYINSARERVVRDTGCLRTLQITQTPISSSGNVATIWSANTAVNTGDYLFSNIFIYEVTAGGTTGDTAPPYPASGSTFPPTAPFTNGTATLQYSGPCGACQLRRYAQRSIHVGHHERNDILGQQPHPAALLALEQLQRPATVLAELRWQAHLLLHLWSGADIHSTCARPKLLHGNRYGHFAYCTVCIVSQHC